MKQIAVRAVQLDNIKTGRQCPPRCGTEIFDQQLNLAFAQGVRGRPALVEWKPGRGNGGPGAFGKRSAPLPRPLARALKTGVKELDACSRSVRVEKIGNPFQGGRLLVVPDARAAFRDPAGGVDRRRFHEHETCAAQREPPQMHEMEVCCLPLDSAVHRHRRDHHPVAQRKTTQCQGLKQQWCGRWLLDLSRCHPNAHPRGPLNRPPAQQRSSDRCASTRGR